MILRRLELFGFKSFADPIEFEFSPGVTAIVGPNGSGKSNVVDALLWVLGERGRKVLRTEQPVDVIFAGARQRPRLNLAEVTLLLDNRNNWLPLDFTEVAISRRIHRSGDSEFFINRQPCRLRDIQDLFLDTGVGQQAYSFVTQNEMDAILSLRPEERRSLFDEAAGINKYRHRKNETLRRLEEVERNLTRVADLMHGITLECETLGEQVKVTRQYQSLMDELHRLQLGLLVKDYDLLHQRVERYREREQELEAERGRLATDIIGWEVSEQRSRLDLARKDDVLDELHQELAEASRRLERAEGELTLLQERQRSLQQREHQETQRRQTTQARLLQLTRDQERRQGEEKERQAERLALQQQLQQLAERIEVLRDALQSADAQTAQQRAALIQLVERRSRLQGQWQQGQSLLAEWEDQRAQRVLHLQNCQAAEEAASQAEMVATQRYEQAQAMLREVTEAVREAQAALQACAEQVRQLEQRQAAERAELSHLDGRLRVLRETEARYEGFYRGVRSVLQARDRGELPGTYAVVTEWLQVPAPYETAIESALGGRLQDIVTATGEAAQQAIDYLKAHNAGRATFLPLDLVRSRSPHLESLNLNDPPGILGWAFDLVRFPARFEPAARYLLGRLLVVQALEVALHLRRRSREDFTLVTLEGDLVAPGGAVSGGSKDAQRPALLSRRREISELETAGQLIQGRLTEIEATLQEARATEQYAHRRAAESQERGEQVQRALAASERQRLQAQSEHARRRREREQAEEQQTAWEERRELVQRQQEQLSEEWAALEERYAREQASLEQSEEQLRQQRHLLQQLERQQTEMLLRLAELESAQRAAQAQHEQWEAARLELEQEEQRAHDERTHLEAQQRHLAEERRRQEALLEQLHREQRCLEERLAGARREREELLLQISAALEGLKKNRAALHQVEDHAHRLALQRTEVEGELQHIRRELDEHYDLTLEQARAQAPEITARGRAAEELKGLQQRLEALGPVNLGAPAEFERLQQQLRFYTEQRADLEEARADLLQTIDEIDQQTRSRFVATLQEVEREFRALFQLLFGAQGEAEIALTDPTNLLDSGIEIIVQMPGKRRQNLALLSGGERTLTAIALIFALLRTKPAPFCVLDEVDAPLDEANVERFCRLLREFTSQTQFILVTHNKLTMEMADRLYGVTMQEPGVSTLLSVELAGVAAQS